MAIKPVEYDPDPTSFRQRLVGALESCATEAEIAQVLYTSLSPVYGYQVVTLHVLDRGGGYHAIPVDAGILQERLRGDMARSVTRRLYAAGETAVVRPDTNVSRARGPGRGHEPNLLIWVPLRNRGEVFASVLYEVAQARPVPPDELEFIEQIHSDLGVLVANAYLHETTRDQASRLTTLNDVARALGPTRSREEIEAALRDALGPVPAVESVELDAWGRSSAEAYIEQGEPATVHVPVRDGAAVKAALVVRLATSDPHEESFLQFLEGVADQVALALRNAESNAAELAHRRRLEVVSAAGRRLASTLDRWSIMRTLREELQERVKFDIFIVATVRETTEGPVAEGFAYDSGGEQWLPSVSLASAGPARTAYESGRTVFIGSAPWAEAIDLTQPREDTWVISDAAAVFVTRPAGEPQAARSVAWVPIEVGKDRGALLSIQAYSPGAFDEADVRLLEDLAPYVGLALANADHFEATRMERRRVEALHAIQLGVSEAATPEDVARAALTGMRLFLPGDTLRVHLRAASGAFTAYELDATGDLTPSGGDERGGPRQTRESALERGEIWLPLDAGARPLGALSAGARSGGRFSDIEVEFLEAAAPLVGVALARQELAEAKDLMLRAIGHEIRSPAAAMTATLGSIVEWGESLGIERRDLLLGEAYEMSVRLLALVEAQLLIAKLELGGFEPSPEAVDLGALVHDAIAVLEHRYEGASSVKVDLPAELPPAWCETVHLQQVLTNLVGNAFEHGRPPVRVRARARARFIEVSVTDAGPGPTAEVAAELFEKRGRRTRSRGGLGLGLYLCRLVVERSFGGRIWVQRLARGNAFKFTVPRAGPG